MDNIYEGALKVSAKYFSSSPLSLFGMALVPSFSRNNQARKGYLPAATYHTLQRDDQKLHLIYYAYNFWKFKRKMVDTPGCHRWNTYQLTTCQKYAWNTENPRYLFFIKFIPKRSVRECWLEFRLIHNIKLRCWKGNIKNSNNYIWS